MTQLVAAQATTKTALTAANQVLATAKASWDGALLAWGIEAPRHRMGRPGQPVAPAAPPTTAQQDLTGLGTALKAAITAQAAAQSAYNTARKAVTDALVAAGAT
jgi:hypothetical protein